MRRQLRPVVKLQALRLSWLCAVMATALIAPASGGAHATDPVADMALDPAQLQSLLRARAFADLDDAVRQTRDDLTRGSGSEARLITLFDDAATSDPATQEGLAAWHRQSSLACEAATARAIGLLYRADRAWDDLPAGDADAVAPAEVMQLRNDARRLLVDAMALRGCAIAHVVARPLLSEQEARRSLERALRDAPDSVLLLALAVPIKLDGPDPGELVPDAVAARLSPAATRALEGMLALRRGQLLAQAGWALRAAQSFDRALRSSSSPVALGVRARFFETLGWREDARRDYLAALEIDHHFRPAHLALARDAIERQALDRASAHIAMLLEIDPRDPIALQLRADLHLKRDEPDLAIEALQAALVVGSHRPDLLAELAELRMQHRQDLDRSLAYYEAAIDLAPDEGRYHAAAAMVRCMQSECWLLWELQELHFLCDSLLQCDAGVAEIANRAVTAQNDDAGIATADALATVLLRLRHDVQNGPGPPS